LEKGGGMCYNWEGKLLWTAECRAIVTCSYVS
jgi:hypothetical protein